MDEITDRELGDALRVASEEVARAERPSTVSLAAALRTRLAGPEDPLAELAAALEYYPVDPEGCAGHLPLADAAAARCNCYGSLGPVETQVFPLWVRALAYAPRPLVAARFADLLWTARYGDSPHEWARGAVDAYLAAVDDQFGHVLEVSEGLQRAFGIAVQIDDDARRAAVVSALIALATRSMEGEERSPGVSLSIIDFLAGQPPAGQPPASRPPGLAALLEQALDRYRHDPWLLESALDIKARLVEPCEREELRVTQVEAFTHLARHSAGQLRYAHYEHAIELAERYALSATAARLRAEIDTLPEEMNEPDIEPAAPVDEIARVDEPRDPVADFVDRIVGDDDLILALARLGACLPTEGDTAGSDDEEKQRLLFFGMLAVELLARIRDRYGAVSAAGPWFECALIEATVAARVEHAIELYEFGDFDASVSVLTPWFERIIRSMAKAAAPAVTATHDFVDAPEEDREIIDVFDALGGSLYEPSRRYLRAVLSEPRSAAVATPQDAALLVHAACHLRLLRRVDVATPS